jgi:hypothetical protein
MSVLRRRKRHHRSRRLAPELAWLSIACACACGGGTVAPELRSGSPGSVDVRGPNAGAAAPAAGGGGPGGAAAPVVTRPDAPWNAEVASSAGRKVKDLLTGMQLTDADQQKLEATGAAAMQELVQTWMDDSTFQPMFRDKMLFFFRQTFQQTGFVPTEDFKMQLLENGGFDLNTYAVGDDAFARIVQNLQDSFALTAWQLITDGRPFNETLTTQRYMLTTALKSLYLQIEMPNERTFARNSTMTALAWKVDYSGNAIALEDTLNPQSPNYMVFSDEPPVTARNTGMQTICRGGTTADSTGAMITSASFTGYGRLFQRLLGDTPRYSPDQTGTITCNEHASKPYFTTADLTDWQWVNVRSLNSGEALMKSYDLPTLRTATELALNLPRMGFFTTPAFLALWNTNDSNQHRVTANQTLLVALGVSLSSSNTIIPLSTAGLDAAHAVDGSECYGCHKTLDPLRSFWGNQYDFNDRNDFPTRGFMMTAANPRPTTLGGGYAVLDMNTSGASMLDLGGLLAMTTDGASPEPLNGFAKAMTQKLCYYANSDACATDDPEFSRVVLAFQHGKYDFKLLIREFFSSPLVTGATPTTTYAADMEPVSISRRDHLCASLSNRLGKPDICSLAVPVPSNAQASTARIASSVSADGFSRGGEAPITPADPTLFHRAATEMLCENVAAQVVDGMNAPVYTSANFMSALDDMVSTVMGYPSGDGKHAQALQILTDHYNAVRAQKGNSATNALRSTFVLACEAPTSVSIGL